MVLWVGTVSMGLLWFSQQANHTFDQQLRLQQWVAQPHWGNDLLQQIRSGMSLDSGSSELLVEVLSEPCHCNWLSSPHREQVKQQAIQQGMTVHSVMLSQLPISLQQAIPATPLVLVFRQQQWLYVGPFASGAMCSASNSLVSPWLSAKPPFYGTTLASDAQGCFCLTPST